ncbi:hypothetical protein QQG55_39405 [Brugia pahangi]
MKEGVATFSFGRPTHSNDLLQKSIFIECVVLDTGSLHGNIGASRMIKRCIPGVLLWWLRLLFTRFGNGLPKNDCHLASFGLSIDLVPLCRSTFHHN